MGIEFLYRVTKTSVVSGMIVAIAVAAKTGWDNGLGFAAGCGWSLANIHLIRMLVALICADDRHRLRIAGIVIVKVPLMYGIGFVMLYLVRLPLGAVLAGFMWPLLVVALKSVARIALRIEESGDGLGVQKN